MSQPDPKRSPRPTSARLTGKSKSSAAPLEHDARQPKLVLRSVEELEPDAYYFERRQNGQRYAMSGRVTGVLRGPNGKGTRMKVCGLNLVDVSHGGLGLQSQEPIEKGTQISVFIPPNGHEAGRDLMGNVVRCTRKRGDAFFSVGIELAEQMYGRTG